MVIFLRVRKVIFLLLVVFVVINSYMFWIVTIDDREYCILEENYEEFYDKVMLWLDVVIYFFVSFVVLLTFNILIIYDNRKVILRRRLMRS